MSTCSLKVLLYNFQFVFLVAPENIFMSCDAIKNNKCLTCQSNGLHKKRIMYLECTIPWSADIVQNHRDVLGCTALERIRLPTLLMVIPA